MAASHVVILNLRSGRQQKARIAQELKSLIAEMKADCDVVAARGIRRVTAAARAAARSHYQTVIAGGGDGTINAVASELIGTDKRLGVLPIGTFNYFARAIGMPLEWKDAFRACMESYTVRLPIAEVNGRIFLNNASIGLYPVILSVREQTYRRWGRNQWTAYWSVLWTILRLRLNMRLTITADGEQRSFHTPMVFVARNALQLEEFDVPGIRCITEQGFSVYVLRPAGKIGLLRIAWRTFMRRLDPATDFDLICTDQMQVDSKRMLRVVAFDGERVSMSAPLHFRMHPAPLNVAVPRRGERTAAA